MNGKHIQAEVIEQNGTQYIEVPGLLAWLRVSNLAYAANIISDAIR